MNHDTPFAHPAWIDIDLAQFKQNIRQLKQYIGARKLCLPIKANAYGHGLIPIATAAQQEAVDYLAVSCLQEGILLRTAGIHSAILTFGPVYPDQVQAFVQYDLELTISSLAKAQAVAKALKPDQMIKIHVEIDTGMRRTGIRPDSCRALLNFIQQDRRFCLKGVYSHLATADQPGHAFTQQQIQQFAQLVQKLRPCFPQAIFHLANSGGILYYPDSYFDMVRPGKLVFGYMDAEQTLTQAIFSVKAKVAYFKVVSAGSGISYGHTYQPNKTTRVVTIPVGYGDGYRRALSNKARVLIHGKAHPVVGTICMDQFMVDIGPESAYVGDEVVLIGHQGEQVITLAELASLAGTIPSELLCQFNDRLPRYYRDGEQQFWEYNSLNNTTKD